MKVIVAGDIRADKPVIYTTTEATAIYIETDDGKPNVIFRMLPNGRGWVRSVKGEDKNFDTIARQCQLIK